MAQPGKPESFRGDFEPLAAVMADSWGQNQDQSLLYGLDFLRSAFAYPGASFALAPTIYVEGRPAAFVAGFPRTVRLNSRELHLLCMTLLTSSVEYKGRGYGSQVTVELLQRAFESGFEGAISFCVDGAVSNELLVACGKRLGADTRCVFSARYLARLLRPAVPPTLPAAAPDVLDIFLSAAAQVPQSVPLIRLWSREEAEWQCLGRTGALYAARRDGSRSGIVTGYLMEIIQQPPAKVLLLEDLLWGELETRERLALLQELLAQGVAAGAQMAVVPLMEYAETETLRKAGFRQSRQLMHMYWTALKNSYAPEPFAAAYVDVF